MKLARFLTALACTACTGAIAQPVGVTEPPGGAELPLGVVLAGGQMQVGRYTTTVATPAGQAADPLDVFVRLSYPRQTVSTVGDALRHTLLRTGWRLVESSALTPQAAHLLGLPLPESQRQLGPYKARAILEVLTGPEEPVSDSQFFSSMVLSSSRMNSSCQACSCVISLRPKISWQKFW